ncbi:MAG: hypothetical protein PHU33_18070, partial [Bacteroidales bacterium]|nr:hypothetical protein [Bacteroidales bacterium]
MELIRQLLSQYLTSNDDPVFWQDAIEYILLTESPSSDKKTEHIFARVGACSHWLRPHQTRWRADGGFAAPIGYGSSGYSRHGKPETEWEVILAWNNSTKQWEPAEKLHGKK